MYEQLKLNLKYKQSKNELHQKIKLFYLKLISKKTKKIVITNKLHPQSKLLKEQLSYQVIITKESLEFRKTNDDYKNKVKYIFNSDTVVYHNRPILNDEKKAFFK